LVCNVSMDVSNKHIYMDAHQSMSKLIKPVRILFDGSLLE